MEGAISNAVISFSCSRNFTTKCPGPHPMSKTDLMESFLILSIVILNLSSIPNRNHLSISLLNDDRFFVSSLYILEKSWAYPSKKIDTSFEILFFEFFIKLRMIYHN